MILLSITSIVLSNRCSFYCVFFFSQKIGSFVIFVASHGPSQCHMAGRASTFLIDELKIGQKMSLTGPHGHQFLGQYASSGEFWWLHTFLIFFDRSGREYQKPLWESRIFHVSSCEIYFHVLFTGFLTVWLHSPAMERCGEQCWFLAMSQQVDHEFAWIFRCFLRPSITGTSLRTIHTRSQRCVSLHNSQNRSHIVGEAWHAIMYSQAFPCTSNCLFRHHSRLYFGQSKFLVGKNTITARACGALAGGSGITPVLSTLQDIWQAHPHTKCHCCTSVHIFVQFLYDIIWIWGWFL